jgi:hypothetical protein
MNGRDAFVCVYICTHSCGMMYDLILCRHFYAYAIYIYVYEHARMYIPIHTYLCTYAGRGHFTQSPFPSIRYPFRGFRSDTRMGVYAFIYYACKHVSIHTLPSASLGDRRKLSLPSSAPRTGSTHIYVYILCLHMCIYLYRRMISSPSSTRPTFRYWGRPLKPP